MAFRGKMVFLQVVLVNLILVANMECANNGGIRKDELERRMDEYINAGLACHNNPGFSVSVVRDSEILLAKGYGYKRTDSVDRVRNTTLFGVASLSKSFASALLLKLLDKHNLSVSTTVSSVLGDDIFHGNLRSRYTTLADLLAHRMGIRGNNRIRLDDAVTRKTVMRRLKYLHPVGEFRTSFYYNNLMYGLVTYITEVIGNDTWENLVQSELFNPLGMTSSSFLTTADPKRIDLAQGYQDDNGTLYEVPFELNRRWGELCGSGCVLSNSVDMAKWMMFHMNDGRDQNNVKVVDSDALAEAHKAQNSVSYSSIAPYYTRPITSVTLSHSNYGFGWKLGHYRGYPILTHSGSTFGYRALVTMFSTLKLGIFTAMTGDDAGFIFRTNIHLFIADLLLGETPWLNTTTVCTFPEPWKRRKQPKPYDKPRKGIPPQRNLTSYIGSYRNDAYGNISVYLNNTNKLLTAKYGFALFNLYPKVNKDDFFAEGTGILKNVMDFSTFRFAPDKTGVIESLIVPSFETKQPPTFKKSKISQKSLSNSGGTSDIPSVHGRYISYGYILSIVVLFFGI